MERTIVITGASSGIGKATALHFADRGWKVVATMRDPSRSPFASRAGIAVVKLDVTELKSIDEAAREILRIAPRIDVLLNNAGYGLRGVFEAYTREQVEAQMKTNVTGTMDVVRAFLPVLRSQHGGTIINISSVGGRIGFPLFSVYQASKFAVEGFTEALSYELEDQGIRVRLIEPGFIRTDFHNRSMDHAGKAEMPAYEGFVARTLRQQERLESRGSAPESAARVIYRAATSTRRKMRFPVGSDARLVLFIRTVLPDVLFRAIFRRMVVGRRIRRA
jgi:NAD(P)-dependent dehydrogenase (short-subunit alcohol dehydrogenase family)